MRPLRETTATGSVTTAPALSESFRDEFTSVVVDTGRITHHVVTGGEGPALLLLAGWPQTWYAWRFLMPTLAAHFTVIAADPRGVNLSDKPEEGYDTETLATDMVELMAALGHRRFTMIGHDVGMWTAYALAVDHPGVLERMVVMEAAIPGLTVTPPIIGGDAVNEKLWHFAFNRLPALNELLVEGREHQFFSEQFRTKAAHSTAIPRHAVQEYVDAIANKSGGLHASFQCYRALDITIAQNRDRQERSITIPVLAVGGAQGLGAGVASTMRLAATNVSSVIIDNAGHYPAEEEPEATLAAILNFCVGF